MVIKPEIDHDAKLRRVMHILMIKGCGKESDDVRDALNELNRLKSEIREHARKEGDDVGR